MSLNSSIFSENEHLRGIREQTADLPLAVMQTGPVQARFIAFLAASLPARKVLELGTFTGYTTLSLALALPEDGRLITCDISTQWKSIARSHWDASGVGHKIDFRLRSASHVLDTLITKGEAGTFDFIYIDADKDNQDPYYEKSLELLRIGGLMVIDNILLGDDMPTDGLSYGKAVDISRFSEEQVLGAKSLCAKLAGDTRVDRAIYGEHVLIRKL